MTRLINSFMIYLFIYLILALLALHIRIYAYVWIVSGQLLWVTQKFPNSDRNQESARPHGYILGTETLSFFVNTNKTENEKLYLLSHNLVD